MPREHCKACFEIPWELWLENAKKLGITPQELLNQILTEAGATFSFGLLYCGAVGGSNFPQCLGAYLEYRELEIEEQFGFCAKQGSILE